MHEERPARPTAAGVALAAVLAAWTLGACADDLLFVEPPPQRGEEAIQTDALRYTAVYRHGEGTYSQFGYRLIARFRNPTDRTLYLGRCSPDSPRPMHGVVLSEPQAGARSGYSPAWGCVGHAEQFAVPPGGVRIDTFMVLGPNAWDGHTGQPLGVMNGRYRLIYDVQECPGDCLVYAGAELGRSNAFDVRVRR